MSCRSRALRILISLSLVAMGLGCSPARPQTSPPPPPPPPAATFTLSGTIVEVTAEGTKPASGIHVTIAPTLRVSTDTDGNYSISGVSVGNHVVQITSPFHEPLTRSVSIDSDTRLDVQVVRLPIFTLSGIVFELHDGVRVPVSGVHVENSNIHDATATDQDGEYKILVPRGTIDLFVAKPGYLTQNREVSIQSDTRLEIQLVRQ
jgi:hypothetical protein